nr:hypothetical protein [Tanacetum cinerariifolium]
GRPEETGIKDLFGSEVSTMMSSRGSIVASFENFESFLAVHTPPDHLIRANLKQKRVVPEIVFYILEKLVLLLSRHTLNKKIDRVVLGSFSVNDIEIKLLEEPNPTEQSRLSILFGKEIL